MKTYELVEWKSNQNFYLVAGTNLLLRKKVGSGRLGDGYLVGKDTHVYSLLGDDIEILDNFFDKSVLRDPVSPYDHGFWIHRSFEEIIAMLPKEISKHIIYNLDLFT